MMGILFNGIGWTDIAFTLNRIAVGLFFFCLDITSCSTRSATV